MVFLAIIAFVIILGLLVFVHELGHFLMAKRAGMIVEEFGFGFPPRMFGIKKGETIYSINWIPLGGFVRIVGEDGGQTDNPDSFSHKSAWQRFLVLIAGVTMNLILAWVLISIGMTAGLPSVVSQNDVLPASAKVRNLSVAIVEVAKDSPAFQAGLRPGDAILKVGSQNVGSIEDAQVLISQSAGKDEVYTIKRGREVWEKTMVARLNPPEQEGALGIALSNIALVSYPWYEAVFRGLLTTVNLLVLIVTTFGVIIGQLFAGNPVGEVISGPVGIAVLTRDVTELGFIYLLQFTALLSINLAVINAVPFPALDGGRILFLIIEKLRGKKMHVKAEQIANTIGFVLLLLLMVLVTVQDFGKFDILSRIKNLF